jgi:PTEN phosphatase family protein
MFKVVKLLAGVFMKQRMMFHQDGFALDLTYITNAFIAMSRPAVGSDANFANPIEEVSRFFQTKYPDRYLLFDISAEPSYGDEYFGGRVERIRVEKHNPPRMSQLVAFVEQVGKVLDEDPKTCIAVHCKSGRDRTGVMVASWLMYSRFSNSAEDAMQWFVSRRIGKRAKIPQGFPMVSQQRYVRYMEEAVKQGGFLTKPLVIRRIRVETYPRMSSREKTQLFLSVDEDGRQVQYLPHHS